MSEWTTAGPDEIACRASCGSLQITAHISTVVRKQHSYGADIAKRLGDGQLEQLSPAVHIIKATRTTHQTVRASRQWCISYCSRLSLSVASNHGRRNTPDCLSHGSASFICSGGTGNCVAARPRAHRSYMSTSRRSMAMDTHMPACCGRACCTSSCAAASVSMPASHS